MESCRLLGYPKEVTEAIRLCAARSRYRAVAVVLVIVIILLPYALHLLGAPDWLGGLIVLPAYVTLVIASHYRLRDAALSSGWLAAFFLVVSYGPSWDAPGPSHFYLGHVLILVPIILGFLVPANAGANRNAASA